MGFDPLEASSEEVVPWLIQRTEETASPVQVQTDLLTLQCWRYHACKPLGEIPFETSVAKGLLKILGPKDSTILGLLPNQLQGLLKYAKTENGPENLVGLSQAAIYSIMY